MTNLSGGWEVSRNELLKAESGMLRRMLLLTDGVANRGIRDHRELITLVGMAYGRMESVLHVSGFGIIIRKIYFLIWRHSTGNFYDVDSKEKLPVVFAAELEGALRISIENLRVRVKSDEFCESISDFGGMRRTELLDGCTEYLIGDLVSEEVRSFALEINLKPGDSGSVGRLLTMEFLYDLVQEGD